ncbi:hypothetical protein BDU57DRAFT_118142 [Ampelomyces quisqualis]|uniref:Uncharacterized protein n=1 Tax=Ampelomyces quisqualis TaxID=50730 RepID=A0A6A5QXW4_AMPQU|nr:hypothetical protein BDU57DRAFT_118142 [Ampelomyces quisqualis]
MTPRVLSCCVSMGDSYASVRLDMEVWRNYIKRVATMSWPWLTGKSAICEAIATGCASPESVIGRKLAEIDYRRNRPERVTRWEANIIYYPL